MGEWRSIGAVAAQTGLSVRALRVYEQAGLIQPRRTEAGRRVFDVEDLRRLQQILLLKRAGCKLAQIATLLRQRTLDPAKLIDLQIAALEQQHQSVAHALGVLKAARQQIDSGVAPTMESLCNLIKLGENIMSEAAWQPVWDQYYTPEEQQRWKEAKQQFSAADSEAFGRRWRDLIARVESVMAQGIEPGAVAAMELAREWHDLQKPLVESVGTGVWNKAAKMYTEMDQWQADSVKAPFSPEVYGFMVKASEFARAQGMIPPRAAAG